LQQDPSEKYDVAANHPEIIKDIEALAQKHQATVEPVKSNLDKIIVQN